MAHSKERLEELDQIAKTFKKMLDDAPARSYKDYGNSISLNMPSPADVAKARLKHSKPS